MKHLITIFLLLIPVFVRAQDAVVVPLTMEEASQARALHAEAEEAQKKWDKFREKIEAKYTFEVDKPCVAFSIPNMLEATPTEHKCGTQKVGWQNATMEFSKDFHFIVPKPIQYVGQPSNWGCGYATPAVLDSRPIITPGGEIRDGNLVIPQ